MVRFHSGLQLIKLNNIKIELEQTTNNTVPIKISVTIETQEEFDSISNFTGCVIVNDLIDTIERPAVKQFLSVKSRKTIIANFLQGFWKKLVL